MSRKIRSGLCCVIALIPSKPSLHSCAMVISGKACRYSVTILLASGSSSINTVLIIRVEGFLLRLQKRFQFVVLSSGHFLRREGRASVVLNSIQSQYRVLVVQSPDQMDSQYV